MFNIYIFSLNMWLLNIWFSLLSVQKNYNAVQKKPNISMWRPKYIKYCLIGKTYKAVILYACFYVLSLLYYDFAIQHETCENISDDNVTHLVSYGNTGCGVFNRGIQN